MFSGGSEGCIGNKWVKQGSKEARFWSSGTALIVLVAFGLAHLFSMSTRILLKEELTLINATLQDLK